MLIPSVVAPEDGCWLTVVIVVVTSRSVAPVGVFDVISVILTSSVFVGCSVVARTMVVCETVVISEATCKWKV